MVLPSVKYTVFVSSTHTDLKDEREAVTDEILKLGHIPCGMEQFSASTGRGWEVITRTIDICDYYVLVIAGRYGSTFSDEETKSWTEKEYEYALRKGLDVLAFIREDASITKLNTDEDPAKAVRLKAFVDQLNRKHLCEPWTTSDDLCRRVVSALAKQIYGDERDAGRRRSGWYRGDNLPADPNIAKELARLSSENAELRTRLSSKAGARPRAALELQTDDGQPANGRMRVVQRTLKYESKHVYFSIPGQNPQVLEQQQQRQRIDERHAGFVEDLSRMAWISLRVFNSGGDIAQAVRARFWMAPVDAEGTPGQFGRVLADAREAERRALLSERAGDVYIESAVRNRDGRFLVVQRIGAVGVGREEGLIRMGIYLPRPGST